MSDQECKTCQRLRQELAQQTVLIAKLNDDLRTQKSWARSWGNAYLRMKAELKAMREAWVERETEWEASHENTG